MKLLSSLLLLTSLATTTGLSGVWTGGFRGGDSEIPQLFTFHQQGSSLTGTGGPDSTEQFSIVNGTITGNTVKFEIDNGQRRFFYVLSDAHNKLRGHLTIRSRESTLTTTVWLDRSH